MITVMISQVLGDWIVKYSRATITNKYVMTP